MHSSRVALGIILGTTLLATSSDASECSRRANDRWQVEAFTAQVNRANDPLDPGEYPSDETDFYIPVAEENELFPLLVFLQGGLVDKQYYSEFAEDVASQGYVVAIPNHLQNVMQMMPPMLLASQWSINDIIDFVTESNDDSESRLYGLVDTEVVGISGHSFGGGAALFAASGACQYPFCGSPISPNTLDYILPDQVKTSIIVSSHLFPVEFNAPCPCDPTAQAPVPYGENLVPVALVSGALDDPACTDQSFDLIPGEKALILLDRVNHFGVTDVPSVPLIARDCVEQSRPQAWSIRKFAKWTGLVLDVYLKEKPGARKRLEKERGEGGIYLEFDDGQL